MSPSESAPGHPDHTDTMLLGSAVRVALHALSRTLRRDEQDRTLVSVARIEEYLRLVLDQFPTAAEHRGRGPHAAAVRATSLGCDNLADGHLAAAYLALTNAQDALGGTAT